MDIYDFEDYTPLPRKYNRNKNVVKTWELRLSKKIKQTKSITKRLEYEMAIMNVKYPFLELPQRRGKALAKMKIQTFMGQIHTIRTIYQLAPPRSKTNILQMASGIQPYKTKAKQDIKGQPRTDIKIRKKSMFKAQIYVDPGESIEDCSQSQKSQNYYSASHNMFKGIHNISSKVTKEVMTSNFKTSQVIQDKPKGSSLDICKRNILNVTKKGDGKIRRSQAILSIQGTKEQKEMDSQRNEKVQVKNSVQNIKLFSTSICKARKSQEYTSVKDSETKEAEEDIKMSKIYTEGKYIHQIKNNKFTLGAELLSSPASENRVHNGDNDDYSDNVLSSDQSSPLHCIHEPTVQESNTRQNAHNDENIDYTVHVKFSAPSSPSHCINKSIQQTNSGADVLPEHSPLHYVSLGSYSSSQEWGVKTFSSDEEVYSAFSDAVNKGDDFLPNMSQSNKNGNTVRSISHRKLYKTSGSRSQNYITTTTQTTQKSSLSDDYDIPTGDSNPSSCADFLADMFDRTAEVYHHHLRAVAHTDVVTDNCKTALDM